MTQHVVIAGGGIGGLACALALARAGVSVDVLEQASAFGEVGAGLQLGPNAVRVLHAWGLTDELQACAAFPELLWVRDAHSGQRLGQLRLGAMALARYAQPYATLHRADLHGLLLRAVQQEPGVRLHLNTRVAAYEQTADAVQVTTESDTTLEGQALIGSDGLWSRVRAQMLGAQPVRASGHLAYRGMVHRDQVPAAQRDNVVTAWLGPRLHVVHYPVKQGEWFNVVAVVHGVLEQGHGGQPGADPQSWTHEARAADLQRALGPACSDLLSVIDAVPAWSLWALNDRPAMAGAREHAQGRVALLGDAAHPTRPYLAQGAAMALEDAWTLGRLLALPVVLYQVWAFVAPGLYSHEKRFAIPLIVLGSLLAYVGIAFVQFFVLDKMFGFIQQFTPASVAATPDIASYVEAILSLYLAFGLAFQVPIVVMLLVRFEIVTVEKLKAFRGYFIVVAFVIAAIVTPPDVISQLALAVPMCLLYEAGIWASYLLVRKPADEADGADDGTECRSCLDHHGLPHIARARKSAFGTVT